MQKTIRHFIVELDFLSNDFSFGSSEYKKIRKIINELEDLIYLLETKESNKKI